MFDYNELIGINEKNWNYQYVLEKLTPFTTPERLEKIKRVIEGRTKNIGVLMERVCDMGNMAAVIRSMENLGFQKLDIIESEKIKLSSRVTNGAHKWVERRKWDNVVNCMEKLKAQGHQIVATSLQVDSVPMTQIDFTKPTVVCFGNEKDGVSQELLKYTDINCTIPTVGFSQSFNISVAAAILLSYIKLQREEKLGKQGDLSEREKEILKAHYLIKSCKNPERYFQ